MAAMFSVSCELEQCLQCDQGARQQKLPYHKLGTAIAMQRCIQQDSKEVPTRPLTDCQGSSRWVGGKRI